VVLKCLAGTPAATLFMGLVDTKCADDLFIIRAKRHAAP
jgi:hypothetical protein